MTDGTPILILGVIVVVVVIAIAIGNRGHKRRRKPPYADYGSTTYDPTWSGLGDNHDSGFFSVDWGGDDSGGGCDSGGGGSD